VSLRLSLALFRGALLVAVGGAAATGLVSLCREPLRVVVASALNGGVPTLTRWSFEQVLTGGCTVVVVGCALWLVAVTVLAVVSQVARVVWLGRRVSCRLDALVDRLCPALVRALVATAVGAVVTTAATAPAPADASEGGSRDRSSGGVDALSGLALPDRVVIGPPGGTVHRTVPRRTPGPVVVRRGDSLWSIAAELLPAGAGDRRICTGWHRLYRANRGRIGADPDLIHPGTTLVVPRPLAPRREDHP
jgi:hypothetical protein